MNYWVSDEHYHHYNIISYCNRPFKDINHMNEELIRIHNSIVTPEDTVYHLGDFTLSKTAVTEILPRLNGIHHMAAIGNHDHCHPVQSKSAEKLFNSRKRYFDAGFKTLELGGTIKVGEYDCLMSHFPYYDENPEYDQRFKDLRPKDEGKILLHGHVHICWQTKISPRGSLMVNVGVDVNNYKPISELELVELIKANLNK